MMEAMKKSPMKGSENPAKLDGKVVVITGANAGIGKETANDMYKRGASVIMLCRSEEKANAAMKWISDNAEDGGKGSLRFELCDMSSMKSVRSCADRLLDSLVKMDILVNNAGIAGSNERTTSEDGFELTFATNHLGHFLLTELLMPLLKKSAESGFKPRIVNVSSTAHKLGSSSKLGIIWDDMNQEKKYDSDRAYSQSKLANVLHAMELAKRLKDSGIVAFSLHPGFVDTEIFDKSDAGRRLKASWIGKMMMKMAETPLQGAQTTLYCCLEDSIMDKSGGYFNACKYTAPKRSLTSDADAQRLWEETEKLLGITSKI